MTDRRDAPAGPPRVPLTEDDSAEPGLIPPRPLRPLRPEEPVPPRAVLCFFPEVIARLEADGTARRVARLPGQTGAGPVLAVPGPDGGPVAVLHPGVGAPLAVLHLEVLIASGVRDVVACGGAGALAPGLALGHVVVPTAAVRDEGTSYHYLPPAPGVDTDPDVVAHLTGVLDRHGIDWTAAPTWTTDAPYRETPGRIARRRDAGCVTVEMETAALAAVCGVRGVRFGQYLYAADDVSGVRWDHRRWTRAEIRGRLLELAVEAVGTLPPRG